MKVAVFIAIFAIIGLIFAGIFLTFGTTSKDPPQTGEQPKVETEFCKCEEQIITSGDKHPLYPEDYVNVECRRLYTCDGNLVKTPNEEFEKHIINMRQRRVLKLDLETEKTLIAISNALKSDVVSLLNNTFRDYKFNNERLSPKYWSLLGWTATRSKFKYFFRNRFNSILEMKDNGEIGEAKEKLKEIELELVKIKTPENRDTRLKDYQIKDADALIKYFKIIENFEIGLNTFKEDNLELKST